MTTHFSQRCVERGITTTDPDILFADLKRAILDARNGAPQSLVEFVFEERDAAFWRFRCQEGIFYALTKPNGFAPLTIYTQEMLGSVKTARKGRKKRPSGSGGARCQVSGRASARRASGWSWRQEIS